MFAPLVKVLQKSSLIKKAGTVKQGKQLIQTASKGLSSEAAEIFASMTMDSIGEAAKNDEVNI
jgi:hypothetical protein